MTTATLILNTFSTSRKSAAWRRAQLIRIAHRIGAKVEAACIQFHEVACSDCGCFDPHEEMFHGWLLHRQMSRYDAVVAALVAETGLPAYSVRNALTCDPSGDRLLFAGL